ncbi:MAG: peptidylprolyl isomerase [Clostridia bacterium]|nr:peptidylprolyl isomerase [Clostridia bacterium]
MGKGQRSRETRALVKNENTQVKKPVKKENKWVTPLVTTLVIVFLVGILVLTTLTDNGVILRSKTVLKTDNFKVSGTVMKYAAMSTYNNMVNQFGEEIAQYLQFDNMKDSARTALEQYLVYAEAAKAAGVTLDEDDYKSIDDNIAAIEDAAKQSGYSKKAYMSMLFGKGVNEKDMREFFEIALLSSKYETQIYNETKDAVTDEDIEAYYKENTDTLAVADVIKYTETLKIDVDLSTEEKDAKKAEFLAKFDAMGAAQSEEEFKAALVSYLTEKGEEAPETKADEASATLTKSNVSLKDAADWLFEKADDAFVRANGDVKVFVDDSDVKTESEKTDETNSTSATTQVTYTVEVYFVVKAPYANDALTKSTGHILMAFDSYETKEEAKAKADEVYAEYLAGEQTKDAFEALAEKYTDDSGVFYDDITEGQMVEPFETWVFDETRAYGDTGIVETEYGYHIMFFTGEATWLATSRNSIISEKTGDIFEEYKEAYPVTANESAYKSVKG